MVRVCADTGSSLTIAVKWMYKESQKYRLRMKEIKLTITLANGQRYLVDCYKTIAMVGVKDREMLAKFITLLEATRNKIRLGTYFLESTSISLDVKNRCWFFCNSQSQVSF
ncbi:hypothetical protein NPIL_333921 [Nephila pilipes]|uniref:Uncharacterized protein n=1 Tax=Nephila pilipes TaxID=299642 RepID=A0A8X6NNW3_NEPPI|nr:hypothetical protein NPIL_333921 [Nephila pilipes]